MVRLLNTTISQYNEKLYHGQFTCDFYKNENYLQHSYSIAFAVKGCVNALKKAFKLTYISFRNELNSIIVLNHLHTLTRRNLQGFSNFFWDQYDVNLAALYSYR